MITDRLLIDYLNEVDEYQNSNGRIVSTIVHYSIDGIYIDICFKFESDDRTRTVQIDIIHLMNWLYCKMLEK